MGGNNRGKRGRVFRNNDKGHRDKTKWGWDPGRAVGMAVVGGSSEGKMQTTVLEHNKKYTHTTRICIYTYILYIYCINRILLYVCIHAHIYTHIYIYILYICCINCILLYMCIHTHMHTHIQVFRYPLQFTLNSSENTSRKNVFGFVHIWGCVIRQMW